MNDYEYLAEIMCEQLESGSAVVLVSIVSVEGSSPRHSGSKMVVGGNGTAYGTIGGGLLEAMTIAESKTALQQKQSVLRDFEFTDDDASAEGMICGGTARILIDFVPPARENVEFFKRHHDLALKGDDFYFLTVLGDSGSRIDVAGRSLVLPDGTSTGTYSWTEEEFEEIKSELHNISSTTVLSLKGKRVIIDPVRRTRTVYCFGAGHVALPTAHMAALVGFQVVVLDDRADFANARRFPEAGNVLVIDSFEQAMEGLSIDSDSFIVILTRGHQYDRVVLEQALKTDAGYIGMIGSRRKRDAIYAALLAKGVTLEQLARVHSPIGLAIKAETPEEIAVSIVAELVQERARQKE